MSEPMSRGEVEVLLREQVGLPADVFTKLWDIDAALRSQLDLSMQRQETLAANVNAGLLEIRDLTSENAQLKETNSKAVDVLVFEAAEKLNQLQEVNARHVLNRIDMEGQFSDLRAQLAAVQEVRDEYHEQWMDASDAEEKWKEKVTTLERDRDLAMADIDRYRELLEDKKQQLAAMTQERNDLRQKCDELARLCYYVNIINPKEAL